MVVAVPRHVSGKRALWKNFGSCELVAGNNPVNMYDPDGNDATIVLNGCDLIVYVPIYWGGEGASAASIARFTDAFESQWSGQFGKYNVKTIVTEGLKNTVHIGEGYGDSKVINKEHAFLFENDTKNIFAHEGGHLLGLDDAYYTNSGRPFPGYEDNIMGNIQEGPKNVFESDIDEMLNSQDNTVIEGN